MTCPEIGHDRAAPLPSRPLLVSMLSSAKFVDFERDLNPGTGRTVRIKKALPAVTSDILTPLHTQAWSPHYVGMFTGYRRGRSGS